MSGLYVLPLSLLRCTCTRLVTMLHGTAGQLRALTIRAAGRMRVGKLTAMPTARKRLKKSAVGNARGRADCDIGCDGAAAELRPRRENQMIAPPSRTKISGMMANGANHRLPCWSTEWP